MYNRIKRLEQAKNLPSYFLSEAGFSGFLDYQDC
jgi:hypothetical protein